MSDYIRELMHQALDLLKTFENETTASIERGRRAIELTQKQHFRVKNMHSFLTERVVPGHERLRAPYLWRSMMTNLGATMFTAYDEPDVGRVVVAKDKDNELLGVFYRSLNYGVPVLGNDDTDEKNLAAFMKTRQKEKPQDQTPKAFSWVQKTTEDPELPYDLK